jgi:hypothetical protein
MRTKRNTIPFFVFALIPLFSRPAFPVTPLSDTCLLTTAWDQCWPYNAGCPLDSRATSATLNGHAWVGCGAVAIAQIMKYYNYPPSGAGTVSYTSAYGPLSVDFAAVGFNWPQLPASLSINSDSQTINVLSRVLYQCAVAVRTDFGVTSSGSGSENLFNGFCSTFLYSPALAAKRRYAVAEGEWDSIICTELNQRRPVLYSALGRETAEYHTFVLDGYRKGADAGIRYHCNWGWGGRDNGYFLLDSLFANSGHYGNDSDLVIFRISPPTLPAPNNLRFSFTTKQITTPEQADTFMLLQWDPVADPGVTRYQVYHWDGAARKQGYYDPATANPLSTLYHPKLITMGASDTLIFAVRAIGGDSIGSLYSNTVMITQTDINAYLPVQRGKTDASYEPFRVRLVPSANMIAVDIPSTGGPARAHKLKVEVYNCSGALLYRLSRPAAVPGRMRIPFPRSPLPAGYLVVKATLDDKATVAAAMIAE